MSLKNKELTSITYLTLREYYAGLAMQGLLANPNTLNSTPVDAIAQWSVQQADALITELDKSNG